MHLRDVEKASRSGFGEYSAATNLPEVCNKLASEGLGQGKPFFAQGAAATKGIFTWKVLCKPRLKSIEVRN